MRATLQCDRQCLISRKIQRVSKDQTHNRSNTDTQKTSENQDKNDYGTEKQENRKRLREQRREKGSNRKGLLPDA